MTPKPEPKMDVAVLEERALKQRPPFTAAEAQAQGLVPAGHVWDEETQQPIARGFALERAQLERAIDLGGHLEDWKRNREQLLTFVRNYLEEASYDGKGCPVQGQVRDFYKVPGAGETKALTKRGAEKLGTLFRFGKATTEIVARTETAEYVSATVQVTLVDQYRRPIGSAVSSCSTAEAGFRSVFAQKKYGAKIGKDEAGDFVVKTPGDFRAALNDVVARASKRAYVQAVIVATAADEVFTAAEEAEPKPPTEEEAQEPKTAPAPGPRLPAVKALKQYAGKLLSEIPTDALVKIARTLRERAKNPGAWVPVTDALDAELARRTDALFETADDDFPLD
ncbi:MAG TPA: hypothetical protein VK531_00860 [Gemmatimonadales bacterium]|nr:hypothetical protein [Gemmatimonadales bacterium]